MKSVIAIVLLLSLIPSISFAQDEIDTREDSVTIYMHEGEEAPFEGYLFSIMAVVEIVAGQEALKEECEVLLFEKDQLYRTEVDALLELHKIDMEAEQKKREEIIKLKDEEIYQLQDIIVEQKDDSLWWGFGGLAVGAVLAGGIAAIVVFVQ